MLSYLVELTRPEETLHGVAAGNEVDFLVHSGANPIPVEAKLTATPSPGQAGQVERLLDQLPEVSHKGIMVCLTKERFPLTRRVDAVPLGTF